MRRPMVTPVERYAHSTCWMTSKRWKVSDAPWIEDFNARDPGADQRKRYGVVVVV